MEPRLTLVLVIRPHPLHRPGQRGPERRGNAVQGALPLRLRQLPPGRVQVHSVQPAGILPYGRVAPGDHLLYDGRDRGTGFRIGATPAGEQGVERLEGRNREPANHPVISQ